jgi:hypothetical protein
MGFALLLVFGSLFAAGNAESQTCDASCLAFQWAYPLWHMANIRFLQSNNEGGLNFAMNKIAVRRGSILGSNPVLCDSNLCSGTPQTLNPAPIVSPNNETIYGAAWLDIRQPWNLTIPNNGARYWAIHFLDMFTNTILNINNKQYPSGGKFCITSPKVTASCGTGWTNTYSIPQYGQFIIRVWSSAASNSTCGVDGCGMLTGSTSITFNYIGSSQVTTLAPKTVYTSSMTGTNGCSYNYNQPICGTSASDAKLKNFWNATCLVLGENPLVVGDPQYTYITSNFASLGITPTGCTGSGNAFAQSLVDTLKPVTVNGGYANLVAGIQTTSRVKGPWVYLTYSGNWSASNTDGVTGGDFYLRAQTSWRLHVMNTNTDAVYYTAFADSSLAGLVGTKSYKVVFSPSKIPIDVANKGFWSLTVCDNTYFMYNYTSTSLPAKRWAIRGNTVTPPTEIHLSNVCTKTSAMCIPVPTGAFNVMLRGYVPTSDFIWGSTQSAAPVYVLPTITSCGAPSACV